MATSIHHTFSVRPCNNPLASVTSLRLPVPLQFQSSTALLPFRSPRFRPSASMSVQAPKRSPDIAFLDRRETGILHFVKYHGLGNDFILVDNRDSSEPKLTPEQAAKICDRNFGVGADGVIFALPGIGDTDYTMRIFNSDGSEPEMCGNGVRCFARFIAELENLSGKQSFKIHTGAGLIVPEIQTDGKVKVDMGQPILNAPDIPTKLPQNENGSVIKAELLVNGTTWNVTCVSMGNPHCVTFGTKKHEDQLADTLHELSLSESGTTPTVCRFCFELQRYSSLFQNLRSPSFTGLFLWSTGIKALQVDELKLGDIGPLFEHHDMFPARTNTEFVEVISPSHLKMRVWERGAGATLACGTGACAVVVAAVLEGRSKRSCIVDLPGGPLEIKWREEDNHVYMTGPAEVVFYGSLRL